MTKKDEQNGSDKTAIAVINNNISYIQKDIFDIKQVLKEGYATKDSLSEVAKQVEKRLMTLESNEILIDARVRKMEAEALMIGGVQSAWTRFTTLEDKVHDTQTALNVWRVVGGFIGGLVFFALTQLPNILKSFGFIK